MQGGAATAAWAVGVFFLRFWRQSRDSLFAFFAAAFWLLGLSWALLAFFSPTEDARPFVYGIRLVAFGLMIAAMIGKNREE